MVSSNLEINKKLVWFKDRLGTVTMYNIGPCPVFDNPLVPGFLIEDQIVNYGMYISPTARMRVLRMLNIAYKEYRKHGGDRYS